MSTRDVERQLITVLHQHAEDAMNRTDTSAQHEELQVTIAQRPARDRLRWAAVAGAAAAIAAVAGLAVWAAQPADTSGVGPAGDPATASSAEAEVAQKFVQAFAAGDMEQLAAHLAPGARWDALRDEMVADGVWRREYFLGPCVEVSRSAASTRLGCPFDYHVLRSDELGLGPFGDNLVTVGVADGKVVSAELSFGYEDNGQSELFSAIGAYVRQNHPGEWQFMANTEGHTDAEMQRWSRLWDRYSQEYVDARTR